LNGTLLGPNLPHVFACARTSEPEIAAKFRAEISLPQREKKASPRPPEISEMDGMELRKNPSSPARTKMFARAGANGQGKCRAYPRDRLPWKYLSTAAREVACKIARDKGTQD
jgi:hypothetical protein